MNLLRPFFVFICALFVFSSCGIVVYIWDGENSYRRRQGSLLCENNLVHEFRAVLTNRDAIPGKEVLRCADMGKPISHDLEWDEERALKENAEDTFFAICRSSLTRTAKMVIKGRKIGIIRRDCIK